MTTQTAPCVTDSPPDNWPPKAHIVDKRTDRKVALCGTKLMGIDLEGMAVDSICEECLEIARG